MKLWLGEEMMFGDGIMVIFCVYFFSMHFVRVCHLYRQAAGLWWQDRYRPIVETVSNLVLNILFVKILGVSGVMFSTIFCMVFIDGTWGTRILFKHYFTDVKQSKFMLRVMWTWVLTAAAGAACYFICGAIPLDGIAGVLVNAAIASVISVTVFAAGSSFLPEFKDAVAFALRIVGLNKVVKKLSKKTSKK